jgi:hypothetical protein
MQAVEEDEKGQAASGHASHLLFLFSTTMPAHLSLLVAL